MTADRPIGLLVAIDDSKFDQMMNARIVERSGLVGEFRQFLDGASALEFLRRTDRPKVDALLLDINMPLMDSFEFLDIATAEFGDDLAGIVVLMLTTSLVPGDMARARTYRAVRDFHNKPLSATLLARIATWLS